MNTPSAKFWQNKNVLVTGHTGFKGSWLSLWLQKMGAKVTGFALDPATNPNLFDLAKVGSGMRSVIGDVRDLESVSKVMKEAQPEIVIHMAAQALVRPSYIDPVGTYATNVMGTVHVLEASRKVDSVRTVVNVTSDKCYENREWAWGYRENEAMGGHDPYSNSKGCSELVTSAFRRSFYSPKGLGLASGRAGNVIGGGDWAEDRLIPDCMKALAASKPISIRNPHSIRPWQHVLEPLSGYLVLAEHLWERPKDFSEGFNFGPDQLSARPVRWIADEMTKIWGGGAKWVDASDHSQPHEAHHLKLDCSLAQSRLGWTPTLSLSETLSWVTSWYRNTAQGANARTLTEEQIRQFETHSR